MKTTSKNTLVLFKEPPGALIEIPFLCHCDGATRAGMVVERVYPGQDQDVVITPVICPYCGQEYGTLTLIFNFYKP